MPQLRHSGECLGKLLSPDWQQHPAPRFHSRADTPRQPPYRNAFHPDAAALGYCQQGLLPASAPKSTAALCQRALQPLHRLLCTSGIRQVQAVTRCPCVGPDKAKGSCTGPYPRCKQRHALARRKPLASWHRLPQASDSALRCTLAANSPHQLQPLAEALA